jgi:7-cyano-7-deazaguanine reductase
MKKDNTTKLKSLGSAKTKYAYAKPSQKILETFPNQFPKRDYIIKLEFKEFTSLCPKTGQPDFGKILIEYEPYKSCLETKSIKLYFFAFRQSGTFMETIVNTILDDCAAACDPRFMRVTGEFEARGGIRNVVIAEHFGDKPFTGAHKP